MLKEVIIALFVGRKERNSCLTKECVLEWEVRGNLRYLIVDLTGGLPKVELEPACQCRKPKRFRFSP